MINVGLVYGKYIRHYSKCMGIKIMLETRGLWQGTISLYLDVTQVEKLVIVEHIVARNAMECIIWFRDLVGHLGNLLNKTIVYNNSQPTIHMTKN